MIRPAKIITTVACAFAATAVIALIGINLYLQSEDVQQRIRVATEDAVGAPVTVRSTIYTPWSGLTLSGLTVPAWVQPAPNMFEAGRFSLRFELLPLLKRRFVVREVTLDKPIFALRQRDDGRWSTTPPTPSETSPETTGIFVDGVIPYPPQTETIKPAEIQPDTHPPAERPPAMPYIVELKKLHIRNGSVLLIDNRGRPAMVLRDIRVTTEMHSMQAGSGEFSIATLEFGEAIKPRDLRGKFHFEGGNISVTDILCDWANGALRATLNLTGVNTSSPQLSLSAAVEDISIPRLLVDATGESVGASGTVDGMLKLEGNPTDAGSLQGHGSVELDSARMQPVDFIRQIGSMFRIDELQMLDLTEAGTEFSIAKKRVHIDRLLLRSDNLMISATGPVKFDGKMDLDARLLLNEKLQHQLRPVLSDNFTASEDADFKQVTFSIKGRLSRPETNLVERMTGIQLGSFGGMIRGLFQTPKREKPADE